MSRDWQKLLIKPGLIRMLDTLKDVEEKTVAEISEEIGVEKQRVKNWAEELEEHGLAATENTAEGMLVKYKYEHMNELRERTEEVSRSLEDAESGSHEKRRKEKVVKKVRRHLREQNSRKDSEGNSVLKKTLGKLNDRLRL